MSLIITLYILHFRLNQTKASNVSCTIFRPLANDSAQFEPISCLNITDGICQINQSGAPIFKPYLMTNLSVFMSESTTGFYSHPMNSMTACLSFCAAKNGSNLALLLSKMCVCSASEFINYFYSMYPGSIY